jgi:hypothetical protein
MGGAFWNYSIEYLSTPSLWNATGDLTIWVYGCEFAGSDGDCLLARSWNATAEYALFIIAGDQLAFCRDTYDNQLVDSAAVPGTSGAFHSFCVTHTGTTAQLYIDNATRSSGTVTRGLAGSTERMTVGSNNGSGVGGTGVFVGYVWHRALTPSELLLLERNPLAPLRQTPACYLDYIPAVGGSFVPAWAAQSNCLIWGGLHV